MWQAGAGAGAGGVAGCSHYPTDYRMMRQLCSPVALIEPRSPQASLPVPVAFAFSFSFSGLTMGRLRKIYRWRVPHTNREFKNIRNICRQSETFNQPHDELPQTNPIESENENEKWNQRKRNEIKGETKEIPHKFCAKFMQMIYAWNQG